MKSSIDILFKYSICIKTIALKIMNCTKQCFIISSIWFPIIEICSHRLFEISSTRFVTHKNIKSFIRIIKKSELNWCSKSSKNYFVKTDHRNKSLMWKKNHRKLFSIIRDRKNELKENAFQRKWLRSISSIASIEYASIESFVTSILAFVSISAFTFVSTSIFTFIFVTFLFLFLAESSNVQSTQQSNVQRISQSLTNYSSTIYENRQYAQKSTNSQRINNWSIFQCNFARYDDHQLS
jgi:hypothetical protein